VNKTRRAAALATGVICAVQFVLQLDFSIVNVALNTIQRELSMAPAELQWIVTGYALTFGSLLLAGGRLADLLGRRRLLVIGLMLFAVASLACGLARWPAMLIVARMVQGAAAALASPAALSLLTTGSPEGHARNRALALWQASTAAGATTGIIAGGLLTQYLGWRAVFLVNPPLIALLLAFVPRLPAGTTTGGGKVGIRGAALVTGAIAALIYGLTEGQQHGFGSPASVAALVAAVVLALAFIYSERKLPAPMIPPSLLAAPARRAAVAAMLLMGAILAGYVYFLSLYLQKVHHFSPVQTGLGLLPATLTVVLMSTLVTRRLLTRFGARPVLLGGLVIMTAGQLWLAFMITRQSGYADGVLPGLLLTAVSIGLSLPAASVAITSGVHGRDQGIAGAMFTTGQQVGAAVGLAVLATAAAARTAAAAGDVVAGYRLSFLIAAGLGTFGVTLVALARSPARSREPADTPSSAAAPAQPARD
jgi:EmrB/QacA subfamily drug resistance transporter